MVRKLTPEQAAEEIPSGATLTVSGLMGNLVPEAILKAIESRFLSTGQPNGLTQIHPWFYGVEDGTGLNRWAHRGLLKRIIGSTYIPPYISKTSELNQLINDNALEAYCFPANAIFQTLRATGAKRSGYLTTVGLETFTDPRQGGGRFNDAAKDDIVHLCSVAGEEHLFYPSIPIDFALIRASSADEDGNLSCENEGLLQGIMVQATAAKNSGGKVIAQVRRVVETGTMHPLMVEVPGVLVDAVVVDETGVQWEYGRNRGDAPATTGEYRLPYPDVAARPHDGDKIVARRALLEVQRGQIVNVGGGIPAAVIPTVAIEEFMVDKARWSVEHGVFGGMCMGATHWNPTSISEANWLLDFYNGGGLDISFLGMGQVSPEGHVNVGKLGEQLPGVGGFVDIAASTRRVAFCGTMTTGGLVIDASDGKLEIVQEGRYKKFLEKTEIITFNGERALREGHEITYITERAVFRLTPSGLLLEEIAPGIDCKSQVLDMCEFPVQVSPNLKTMDPRLFNPEPLLLGLD